MNRETQENGLSHATAAQRLEKYGLNELVIKRASPLIFQFFAEFKDILVIILLVAVVIAFTTGDTSDALIILFIVILNAAIGFIQKYKAEKAVEALKKLISPKARVVREGIETEIEAKYLVPGDMLILAEGDHINADARLIEEYELTVSEAVLTGESTPIKKYLSEHKNTVFMGTMVASGKGKAIVIHTGMNTMFGKIAHLTTSTKKDKSPLEKELKKIGVFVGEITLAISAILFALGYFWQEKPFAETFLFAIAVAVAAVPEGLPATITVALALGVQRLAKKNAISKQLSSVETLGATTVICSDKTGTLTKNEMTVREILINEYDFEVTGAGYNPNDGDLRIKKTDLHLSRKTKPEDPIHDFKIL
ncbi:HAD-IC family P-type ATPase, partial [Candidatus Peregrinibacteria bacterium]|nr:HAD-IC family P-type ATPase [Candidatus Peregrinibacteria bacterium]